MRAPYRLGGLTLAAWALLALASCSAGLEPDQGEPRVGAMLRLIDPSSVSLPLDSYQASPAVTRTLYQARTALFVRCMRRFGFRLQPPQPSEPLAGANERRYGLTEAKQAQQHGYHPSRTPVPVRSSEAELSAAAQTVATGKGPRVRGLSEGGCLGEARRMLAEGGPSPQDPDLADRLGGDSHARSQQDSRVRSAFAAWSGCMRRAGYDYADPWMANDDPAFGTERPSAKEIAVATADVRCKQEVNLVGVWVTVEQAYQQRAIERHAEQLQVVKALLDVQVRNAARILAAGT